MMAPRKVRLERLLGRPLVDAHGHTVGAIEDVVADPVGEEYHVTHVVVGPHAWLPRLLAFWHQIPTLRALGLGRRPRLKRLPWTWLDLSDPEHPQLVPSVVDSD
jgi:hypothetical protein